MLEIFLPKLSLAQFKAISSHSIIYYSGEETNSHLATPSFQVVVENDEVLADPPFFQTEQPQLPILLQTLHQFTANLWIHSSTLTFVL